MKRITILIAVIISFACAKAENIQRTFWGCTLGEITYQQALDTITEQEKVEYKIPKTEAKKIILDGKWWMNYKFTTTTLSFNDNKFSSIIFETECFDLITADEMSKEIIRNLTAKWGNFVFKNGLAKITDNNTEVKVSVTTQQDKGALLDIVFYNLK